MTDISEHLSLAKSLAKLLDSQFKIFGFRFGIDPIFSLIPGVGTIIPTVLSFYTLWIALKYEVPTGMVARMIFYIFIDGLIGSVPLVGTIADAVLKANERNIKILEQYVADTGIVI